MKILVASGALLLCTFIGQAPAQTGPPRQLAAASPGIALRSSSFTTSGGAGIASGGGDDCATPDVIAGQGAHAFDSSLASTGTQGQAECGSIGNDVWFNWTADASGTCTVSTCGAGFDTKLAAYTGAGCPVDGSSIACNDDSCSLQSRIQFNVTSGASYMLQVGSYGSSAGGAGTMHVLITQAPPNDDCSSPQFIAGQGMFHWDITTASTGIEGQGETLCDAFGTTGIDNDIWYTWTADQDGTAIITTCNSVFDSKIAAYAGSGCPTPGSALACNDDSCFLQSRISFDVTAGSEYTLQLGTYPGAQGGVGVFDIEIISGPAGYQYDLGVSTYSLGLPGGAIAWLHAFDAGFGDRISMVSTAFGTPLYPGLHAGQTVRVCIWDDPTNDMDPSDATLLWSALSQSALEDTDLLVDYPAPNVAVSGIFFVGIVHDGVLGGYPATMDETFSSLGRAWIVGNTGPSGGFASFDSQDLMNNDLPPRDMDVVGFPTVFMLRAAGRPELGANYCTSSPNSTGYASVINVHGSLSLADADLLLRASNAPPNQPAIFFFGDSTDSAPFGNGTRCAGGMVRRCSVIYEAGGNYTNLLDFGVYGGFLGSGGASTYFQCWYRDPVADGANFNTSDGIEIIMIP